MKIALTHPHYVADGDPYLPHLTERLLDSGHEVHVFCRSWDKTADPRASLHRIPDRWKRIDFMKAWSYDRWLTQKVQRSGFDVVHGLSESSQQDITTDRSGDPALDGDSEASGEPAEEIKGLHRKQLEAIEERRFRRGNFHKVVAFSKLAAQRLKERYRLTDDEVATIYAGVDTERFHPRNKEKYRSEYRERIVVPQDSFVVLCAGDDFKRRGVPALIEATDIVNRRGGLPGGRTLRVAVIGHERQKIEQELAEDCKQRGVWDQVKFYGPQELLERWHSIADLFALPSHFERFGQSALQAMASGVPALVSCEAGASELVAEGRSGFLLHDPCDAETIADRIVQLASDPELALRMGETARRTAEEYSWDAHFQQLQALYEEVASLKRGTPS